MADDRTPTTEGTVAQADAQGAAPILLNAQGAQTLTVPHGPMLLNAQFARAGADLQLTGQGGENVVIQNFFGTEMAPVLMTEGGGKIMPDVAEALAGPDTLAEPADVIGGGEGDATLMGQSDQPIGTVDTAEGGVFATRADGSRVELQEGDPVFQGDVLETDDEGAVNITFVDNTEFSLDEGARMTLDEMVFDPNTGEGSSTFTVVQGVFTFVSGQVAKSGSDAMTVNTPVATIGIRGTKVAIKAGSEDEDTVITLLQEDDGHVGEIAVSNDAGTQVLNQANQTVFIESVSVAPTQPAILPSEQLRSIFSEGADDTRGLWRNDDGSEQRSDEGGLDQAIEDAKEAAAEEGADEDSVDNAEAAAELAYELALAEGADEEEALEEAEAAFQNALVDGGTADSLIETAAGGDDAGAGDDDGGTNSVFDYNPNAGQGTPQGGFGTAGTGPAAGTTTTTTTSTFVDPVIRGGEGDDTLAGTDASDEIVAGGGNDTVFGLAGDDNIDAGTGNDTVYGGTGDDFIQGGAGNDTLYGNEDDDTILGDAGNDAIFGNDGDDTIEGGEGADVISGGAGEDEISGDEGNDTIFGGAGADTIDAGDGDDFIGTSDDDGSDDEYDGGDGIDTVSFATDDEGVIVNMDEDENEEFDIDENTVIGENTGEDTIENVENIITGSGDDVIIGQTGEANTINAGAGDDLVIGGADDTLIGGAGNDTLRISMTREEFEDPAFQAEVAAYRANPSEPFHFDSINMDVEGFEALQIEVDGTIIVAEPPTLEVGDVYGAEDTAILLGMGASLNDTDGAEQLQVEISGMPEGSTLHYIDGNGVAQSVAFTEGEGSVVLQGFTQDMLDTLAVTPPAGDSTDFALSITATAIEADGSVSSVSDSFNVIVNGIPQILPDFVSGDEDAGTLTGSLVDDIGGDASFDPDSDNLEFSLEGVTPDANGDYVVTTEQGTLTLHPDGTYEFAVDPSLQSLDDGESAVATFTIVGTDDGQPILFEDNTLTVTVTGSNDGPVAQAELVAGDEDAGTLTGNLDATDIDGDDLTFSLAQGESGEGQYGNLTVNADGSYTFAVNEAAQALDDGESAVENVTYEVTDGDEVVTQTVTVTITGSNDGPVAQAETVSGSEDAGTLTGNLDATDIDGDALTFALAPPKTLYNAPPRHGAKPRPSPSGEPMTADLLRTPEDRFSGLPGYPFAPHYLEDLKGIEGTRVHFVDEGPRDAGRVFLCLHGNPSWSYLYRKMIPVFTAAGHRAVAPDLPGFGKSDKPADDAVHTFSYHRNVLLSLIERLDLQNITLVCQDWGGLLGLTLPMEAPERFGGLLVMNTTLATGDEPLSKGFVAWRDWSNSQDDLDVPRLFMRMAPHLSQAEYDAYGAPFPDKRYKGVLRRFPNMVPEKPDDDGAAVSRQARAFWKNDWTGQTFMAIGMQDPVMGPATMTKMRETIRNCPAPYEVADGGHMIPEWGADIAAKALAAFG